MSDRRRENLLAPRLLVVDVGGGLGGGGLVVVSLVGGVVAGVVSGVVVGLVVGLVAVGLGVSVRRWRRGSPDPASLPTVPPLAPRTLRWVRGLLPSDEGAAWLAEVTSCLAEVRDKGERRRYVRSYRRGVPQLIWTSWALHVSGSRSRKLS